jgi:hypothetical protein
MLWELTALRALYFTGLPDVPRAYNGLSSGQDVTYDATPLLLETTYYVASLSIVLSDDWAA